MLKSSLRCGPCRDGDLQDDFCLRRLSRIAIKYDSQALEADALHFSTDILSSGVVILAFMDWPW